MNAAARIINESNVFHGELTNMRLSRQLMLQIIIVLAVLVSALCVVYVTNLQRVTLSQLQLAEQKTHQLEMQWGQLTLEQASLATPARVEQLASDKLHMVIPANKQAVVLRVP